jgi:hypothetical protein
MAAAPARINESHSKTDVSLARLFRGNGLPFSRLRQALLLTAA